MADGSKMVARLQYILLRLINQDGSICLTRTSFSSWLFYGAGANEAPMTEGEHVFIVVGGNSIGRSCSRIFLLWKK